MRLMKTRKLLLALAVGAIPLGTVSNCDYNDGYGTFFYDQGHGAHGGYPGGYDVIIEEEYYEEEIIYEDVYYYYDECSFWDGCYW